MISKDSPKKSAQKTLHVVYFIDSNETKTTSFSIRNLKFAFGLAASFSMLSIVAFVSVFLLLRHNYIKGNELKELKAAQLAQSIVHENLLKEAPFLVVSGSGIMLSKQSSQIADALMKSKTVDLNSEELSFAESEQVEAEATPTPKSENSVAAMPKTQETETAPVASLRSQRSQNDPIADKSNEKFAAQEALQSGNLPNNETNNDPVAFTQIKAIYSDNESRYLLKFVMQNLHHNAASLDGTLCAVLKGKNADSQTVSAFFPHNFQPEKSNKESCKAGLRIRFSRFRPTEMLIRSEQLSLESVTFHLFSGNSHFEKEISLN